MFHAPAFKNFYLGEEKAGKLYALLEMASLLNGKHIPFSFHNHLHLSIFNNVHLKLYIFNAKLNLISLNERK